MTSPAAWAGTEASRPLEARQFSLELIEALQQCRVRAPLAYDSDDVFDLPLAGATAPMSRASEAAVTLCNVGGITDTTAQKTEEQVLLVVCAVEGNSVRIPPYREGERLLPRLDPLPQLVRDD